MAFHDTGPGSAFLFLLGLALTVLVFYLIVRWIRKSLTSLGLTGAEVGLILWATFLGAFINIPLFRFGEGFIGINVGGGIVPTVLSFWLIKRKRLPGNEVLVGVILVAAVSYAVTDYVPGQGVISRFPFWLLPALAAFVVAAFAYWHDRDDAASLAYVTGTLGVLLGADIARLPEILAGPRPDEPVILAIGGAAVFDMVYLTGILAISMQTGLLVKQRQDWSRAGAANPIDQEYNAWLAKKRDEWSDTRRQREESHRRREPGQERPGQERAPRAQQGGRDFEWRPAR